MVENATHLTSSKQSYPFQGWIAAKGRTGIGGSSTWAHNSPHHDAGEGPPFLQLHIAGQMGRGGGAGGPEEEKGVTSSRGLVGGEGGDEQQGVRGRRRGWFWLLDPA